MAKATKAAKAAAQRTSPATAPALPAIGSAFAVTEIIEFEEGRRLIARYRPEHSYRVTDLNQAFVGGLIADGKAGAGAPAGTAAGMLTSGKGDARGSVRT
jgi:hypothetical protein